MGICCRGEQKKSSNTKWYVMAFIIMFIGYGKLVMA